MLDRPQQAALSIHICDMTKTAGLVQDCALEAEFLSYYSDSRAQNSVWHGSNRERLFIESVNEQMIL